MKSDKIFENVLAIVCDECGISVAETLKSNKREAVDARCLLVCNLSKLGMRDTTIAAYLMMTRQGVNKLRNSLNDRARYSYYFKSAEKLISNEVATIYG